MDDKKKILIIEDEKTVRDSLNALLTEADYEIMEAGDGSAGEKEILLRRPDMIILDLNLPRRSGEDILKFIKSHKPTRDIPVIILTGVGTLGKKLSCMLKGVVRFINKPYDNIDLLKTVKKYI